MKLISLKLIQGQFKQYTMIYILITCYFEGTEFSAIIDYDSILYMPIGYAIAFSSLKLCRQHLALNKPKDSKKIGEKFKQQIHNNLLINTNWIDFFMNFLYQKSLEGYP